MFAHRTNAQADIRAEKQELDANQDQQSNIENHVLLKQHRPDKGNLRQRSPGKRGQAQWPGQRWYALRVRLHNIQIVRQAERRDVDGNATHNLVGLEMNGDDSVNERHQGTGNNGTQQGNNHAVCSERDDRTSIRSGQHHSFHRDIDNTAAFRNNAAQRWQEQQRAKLEGCLPEVRRAKHPQQNCKKHDYPSFGELAESPASSPILSPGGTLSFFPFSSCGKSTTVRPLAPTRAGLRLNKSHLGILRRITGKNSAAMLKRTSA